VSELVNKKPIEILGVRKTQRFLKKLSKEKIDKVNDAVHKAGFFLESEVKSSISGQRSEKKSFDTGNMARMVQTDNSQFLESKVFGGADYTVYLEEGTSKLKARRHFKNSESRNNNKIIDFIKDAVK
jgi:hypothetical protein